MASSITPAILERSAVAPGYRKVPTAIGVSATYGTCACLLQALDSESDEKLFVDLQAVPAAVAHIVIDKPEDIQGLKQAIVVVEELNRAVEKEYRLHPVWVVRNQSVNCTGTFLHITAGPCHPVIFQVAPASLQRAGKSPPAVAVATQHSSLLDPENIRVGVVSYVEGQMADVHVLLKGYIGRLILSPTNVEVGNFFKQKAAYEIAFCREIAFCFDD